MHRTSCWNKACKVVLASYITMEINYCVMLVMLSAISWLDCFSYLWFKKGNGR